MMFSRMLIRCRSWQLVGLVVLGSLSIMLICAGLVYHIEGPDPASPINTFFDSFYWAVGTFTHVGYGDIVPITFMGKLATVVLAISSFVCTIVCMTWVVAKTALKTMDARR